MLVDQRIVDIFEGLFHAKDLIVFHDGLSNHSKSGLQNGPGLGQIGPKGQGNAVFEKTHVCAKLVRRASVTLFLKRFGCFLKALKRFKLIVRDNLPVLLNVLKRAKLARRASQPVF